MDAAWAADLGGRRPVAGERLVQRAVDEDAHGELLARRHPDDERGPAHRQVVRRGQGGPARGRDERLGGAQPVRFRRRGHAQRPVGVDTGLALFTTTGPCSGTS